MLAAGVERSVAIKKADHEASKKADEAARNAVIRAAGDAAAVETALSAKLWADADDEEIGTDDDFLLKYIRGNGHENPLHLSSKDIQSIHRQFELYTEYFPPGANGRHRFLVDTETWRTYCELQLQFSQFPLHFVDDERKLLPPEA